MKPATTTSLLETCRSLRAQLVTVDLPLDLPDVENERERTAAVLAQLDSYVIPRLDDVDAPALVVIGGSTGSGKSTLTNSLLGDDVTKPGVLRPTTRFPVLACNPADAQWFESRRILGDLTRVSGSHGSAAFTNHDDQSDNRQLELAITKSVPPSVALLDAPDIDSVVDANRDLAAHLLSAADVWVFVTTAARYADAVPWTFLTDASRRGVSLVMVLNRVPHGSLDELTVDLNQNLLAHDLDVEIFGIEEQPLIEGRIPPKAIAELTEWFQVLSSDAAARTELIINTLSGTVRDLSTQVNWVADAAEQQFAAQTELLSQVDEAYDRAVDKLAEDVAHGTVLRGEVLARWQDVVGTGELLRSLESRLGHLRDRVTAALGGRPRPSAELEGAIEHGVEQLISARAGDAAARVHQAWSMTPAGRQLMADSEDSLRRESDLLAAKSNRMVRDWQGGILDLLRSEGAGKRTTARAMAYGLNGVALVTMISVFAHTGGLTGAEVAIAGGSSAAGQKLLEAVLGDQMVRTLAERAREDLGKRTAELMQSEAERFRSLLSGTAMEPEVVEHLRDLAIEMSATKRVGQ